jgi:hypothetical protein
MKSDYTNSVIYWTTSGVLQGHNFIDCGFIFAVGTNYPHGVQHPFTIKYIVLCENEYFYYFMFQSTLCK